MTISQSYQTEAQFRQAVVDYARLHGWRVYWTWNSKHSPAGYPDLTLVRPPRLVFAELKRDPKYRPTPDQVAWLADLTAADQETYVWTPAHWDKIEAVLCRPISPPAPAAPGSGGG